jgi:hypothetical protein
MLTCVDLSLTCLTGKRATQDDDDDEEEERSHITKT